MRLKSIAKTEESPDTNKTSPRIGTDFDLLPEDVGLRPGVFVDPDPAVTVLPPILPTNAESEFVVKVMVLSPIVPINSDPVLAVIVSPPIIPIRADSEFQNFVKWLFEWFTFAEKHKTWGPYVVIQKHCCIGQ